MKTINKNLLKQATALQKSFQQLCNQNYSCQEDTEKALQSFQQKVERGFRFLKDPVFMSSNFF